MPIIATVEADPETVKLADDIRELLYRDVWEDVKAQLIVNFHRCITQEQYLSVWEILDSRTRNAWKKYVDEGKRCQP